MTISENQEFQQELQELEKELVRVNTRVQTIEQQINFRPLGQRGRFMTELNKTKKKRDLLSSDIERIKAKSVFEENEAFLKDYEEKEKIAKEKERVTSLFNEYKENPTITIPIRERKDKPDFNKIGNEIIDRNEVAVINAQREFSSTKQRSSKYSPAGAGNRASQLQKTRNRLADAVFDVSHEPILTNFAELFAEKKYFDMLIDSNEDEIKEVQKILDSVKKDIALMEKHDL